MGQFSNILQRYQRKQSTCCPEKSYKNIIMKTFILCLTILCIANVNSSLHSFDAVSDRVPIDFIFNAIWWEESVGVFEESISKPQIFRYKLDHLPKNSSKELWNACDRNEEDKITTTELVTCLIHLPFLGFYSGPDKVYDFANKYWYVIDRDGTASLNYDEFHHMLALFSLIDAEVVYRLFNRDSNHYLAGKERESCDYFVESWIDQFHPTDDQLKAVRKAFGMGMAGSNKLRVIDIAHAELETWSIML